MMARVDRSEGDEDNTINKLVDDIFEEENIVDFVTVENLF